MIENLERTFDSGVVIQRDVALVVAHIDELVSQGYEPLTVTETFAPNAPRPPGDDNPWWTAVWKEQHATSCCVWTGADQPAVFRCVLSEEGAVNIYGPAGKPKRIFQLPDAGVWRKGATGYGFVQRIRAIGGTLFVCGAHRQVYRYLPGDRNPLSGEFVDSAGPMRQLPVPPPAHRKGKEFEAWANRDIVLFNDIAGTDENDIYATGDETWHFDGLTWSRIELPLTDEVMHVIKVLDRDRILIGGSNGYLFLGNARTGFTNLSTLDDNQTITGLEWFDNRLFIASDDGLFTWDPQSRKIQAYRTGLSPELQDAHLLEAKDGVLWSFGYKDLAYLDSRDGAATWTRVHHPDNPRIGSAQAKSAQSSRSQASSTRPSPEQQARVDADVLSWLPVKPDTPDTLDLGGLLMRVGHGQAGAFVWQQLQALGLRDSEVLRFNRKQLYDVNLPALGITVALSYTGPRRPSERPHEQPAHWGLSEVAINAPTPGEEGATTGAWHSPWPGGIEPGAPDWFARAEQVWGQPGHEGPNSTTFFVPGPNGVAWVVMLEHDEQRTRLLKFRLKHLGDFVT